MIKFTKAQNKARELLRGNAKNILLFGGSRSGKTFLFLYYLIQRALKCKSKHVILRFRFAHVKQSIWYDSLPKIFNMFGLQRGTHYEENKSDWFIRFTHNDSEIWFGGLDEKERVEKILGNEYSTIYFNEASYIPYNSCLLALTRLAENSGLTLRAYYDCNPPDITHWTYKVFIKKINPKDGTQLRNPDNYISMILNPMDNVENLPQGYIEDVLENLPIEQRRRFLLGEWGEGGDGSYYGSYISSLEENNKIYNFALEPGIKLSTAWDLGIGDSTAIWFFFERNNDIYIYDYYENNGKGIEHYVQTLREKGYDYHEHFAPHDIMNNELGTGKTRLEISRKLGIMFRVVKKTSIDDGINAVRIILPRCHFQEMNTMPGLENLRGYKKEFSEKMGEFKQMPLHDYTSHAADAFRYLALSINDKHKQNYSTNPYVFNNLLKHSIEQRISEETN